MNQIGLVLSGGGIRAMVFHLGVLQCLAEAGYLERVTKISTVSGGSLITGLILQQSGMRWPSSEEFRLSVLPALRTSLTAKSLQWGAVRQLLKPVNWKYFLSRANLLAAALRSEWAITARLGDLPIIPEWSINGTNAENGRRFRFKRDGLGDYESGYAGADRFPLASAMAVSAAFPGGFGPLRLRADVMDWRRRAWGAPDTETVAVPPPARRLHLYDGGVYDNLGLEPFFDAGTAEPKVQGLHIVVSDAGKPLSRGLQYGPFSPFRLARVLDIISEQARALRVRTFHQYLRQKPEGGSYMYIAQKNLSGDMAVNREFAKSFPTTLKSISGDDFDRILRHGRSVAFSQLALG